MTSRERILAVAVCGLVAIMGLFWLGNRVNRTFSRRAGQKRQLESQMEQKRLVMARARHTTRQLQKYEDMSLPSNIESAQSQYQNWLSELSSEFDGEEVKMTSKSKRPDGSTVITCNVSGRADLNQLSEWLYKFYSADALHRIRQMPIKPIADSRLLDVTMIIDALVLPGAPENRDFSVQPRTEIANRPIEQVIDPIIQRNMFASANKPPVVDPISRQSVELGQSLGVQSTAKDDPQDKLTYSLADAPEGAEIDSRSGRISWRPEAIGNYEIVVAVEDDGIPSRRSEQGFVVSVTEPPPAVVETESESEADVTLKFDDAKFTFPIASVDVSGIRQIWLRVRTSGKVLKLREGETVQVGSIQATVGKIGTRSFELTANGETRNMKLDEPLANFTAPVQGS